MRRVAVIIAVITVSMIAVVLGIASVDDIIAIVVAIVVVNDIDTVIALLLICFC